MYIHRYMHKELLLTVLDYKYSSIEKFALQLTSRPPIYSSDPSTWPAIAESYKIRIFDSHTDLKPFGKNQRKKWAEGACVSCALIVGGGTDLEKCANFWAGRTFASFCWVALSNAIKVEIDDDAIVCRNANLLKKKSYYWWNLCMSKFRSKYKKYIFVHRNTKEYLDTRKFLLESVIETYTIQRTK